MVTIAVTAETADEPRVAVSPETVKKLAALGAKVRVQSGAGLRSRYSDDALKAAGAEIAASAADAVMDADILLKVRRPSLDEVKGLKPGGMAIAMIDPYGDRAGLEQLAQSKSSIFSMEFMPRITRAQSMDVLSSQANLAGYKAVVDAASRAVRDTKDLQSRRGRASWLQERSIGLADPGATAFQRLVEAWATVAASSK
mgnify:CR=1 FL=1